jgi:hypothetical protein
MLPSPITAFGNGNLGEVLNSYKNSLVPAVLSVLVEARTISIS